MAVDLFGMIDQLKNNATTQNVTESFRNATGMSIGKEKPFPKCPVGCFIYPEACGECKKYSQKLSEYLSQIDMGDNYYAQFRIDPTAAKEGEGECFYCGAPIRPGDVQCEYCDTLLDQSNTVFRVPSRECIPNPILEAEKIIYEKYQAAEKYQKQKRSEGLIKGILGMGLAMGYKMMDYSNMMTEAEVRKMADRNNISVRGYLEGLFWGEYLTLKGQMNQDALQQINAEQAASRQANAQLNARTGTSMTQPKKSYTMLDYMEKRARNSNMGYMGAAPGNCCGNCKYYVAYDQKCLENSYRHPSGPNDSCGSYRSL